MALEGRNLERSLMNRYALIADQDPARAAVYAALLREEGLVPVVTRDGPAAVAALSERGAPALMVVDLSLPIVDGFELIERVRRLAPPTKAPVLAVSDARALA